jgi:hypothetical protein
MAPLYVGGCVRALASRAGARTSEADPGVLAASGLVAGEGLAGVLVALLVAFGVAPKRGTLWLGAGAGDVAALLVLLGACAFLYRAAREATPEAAPRP